MSIPSKTSFQQFIIKCCQASEWELRKWASRILRRNGFVIKEDDYVSSRAEKEPRYKSVHNLLAIRGDAKVCLVSHTDVCRDHERHDSEKIYYGDPAKKPDGMKMIEPVVKFIEDDENSDLKREIIQDKDCNTQVGGDDRLGVAINLWVALNTSYPIAIYLPTDEEIGLRSAKVVNFPEFANFDLLVETDRGNHSNELVNKIRSVTLADYDTTVRLLEIAWDMGKPRKVVNGNGTDVYELKERKLVKNAVNLTCGYHNSIGAQADEYIDVAEALDTMHYVGEIVKDYSLD